MSWKVLFHAVFAEFHLAGAKSMVQKALTTDMLRRPSVDDLLADAWLSAHREEVHASFLAESQKQREQRDIRTKTWKKRLNKTDNKNH